MGVTGKTIDRVLTHEYKQENEVRELDRKSKLKLEFTYRHVWSTIPKKRQLARPMITINVIGPTGLEVFETTKIDTGADHTLFPKNMAPTLGIDLRNCLQAKARGITGAELTLYLNNATLRVVDDNGLVAQWEADIAFCDPEPMESVAGYVGFREFFNLEFDESKGLLRLEPNTNFPGQIIMV